jgi:hypothetical protein
MERLDQARGREDIQADDERATVGADGEGP